MSLLVTDRAGVLAGVAQPAGPVPYPEPRAGPYALAIGPGRDARSITVGWIGSGCDERARLDLAPDGLALSLHFPQRAGCDAIGIGFGVELLFAAPIDVNAFPMLHGSWSNDLVAVSDVQPDVVAFASPDHGWVGGTTPAGDAMILETRDGGATWRVEGLGTGRVTDIAVNGDGLAWAGRACGVNQPTCHPGLYRWDHAGWSLAGMVQPLRLSFAGMSGAGVFLAPDDLTPGSPWGMPTPELRLTDDGSETWTRVDEPCGAADLVDASRVSASTVVALCESRTPSGDWRKTLHRSIDGGGTWSELGSMTDQGTAMALDIEADGTGWLWGVWSRVFVTADGGATWAALDVVNGTTLRGYDGDAWGGGAGAVIVGDRDHAEIRLLRTEDGHSWTELLARVIPCCN